MARQPAPRIDPRDPSLARIKDFLLWLYTNVPDIQTVVDALETHAPDHISGGTDELDGDKVDIDYSATNYTPTTSGTISTSSSHLTSHLKGVDIKLGSLDTGVNANATAISALQAVQGESVLSFIHSPQPSGSSTTRHMFPGFNNANWGATLPYPWVIIPADGEISHLVARHIASTTGDTDLLTYTVLKSTTGGSTFSTTTVTVDIAADSSTAVRDTTHSFTVSAGDCVGIRFTCAAAISGMPTVPDGGHWASVLYKRTA